MEDIEYKKEKKKDFLKESQYHKAKSVPSGKESYNPSVRNHKASLKDAETHYLHKHKQAILQKEKEKQEQQQTKHKNEQNLQYMLYDSDSQNSQEQNKDDLGNPLNKSIDSSKRKTKAQRNRKVSIDLTFFYDLQ